MKETVPEFFALLTRQQVDDMEFVQVENDDALAGRIGINDETRKLTAYILKTRLGEAPKFRRHALMFVNQLRELGYNDDLRNVRARNRRAKQKGDAAR